MHDLSEMKDVALEKLRELQELRDYALGIIQTV